MAELCHKNGLIFSTEGYGNGSFDNLQINGLPDIPMAEFWIGGGAIETTKMVSSSAHTHGKRIIGQSPSLPTINTQNGSTTLTRSRR
jgi:hypothetical protein